MKALFIGSGTLFIILFFSMRLCAQDSIVAISKIEQLAKTGGKLWYTERQQLGSINNTLFQVVTIRDVETGRMQQALQIINEYNRGTDLLNTRSVILAAEDMQQVVRFMDTIVPKISREVQPGDQSYNLVTSDDVELRFHQLDGATDFYIGRLYRMQRTVYPPSAFWFNRRRISEVASLFKSALTLMQESLQVTKQ